MSAVMVRPARIGDVEAVASIHVAGYDEAYRGLMPDEVIDVRTVELRRRVWRERLATRGRDRDLVLVAEIGGKVAGFASARPAQSLEGTPPERVACLENIYVEPPYIRSGLRVGATLLDATLRALRELGFSEVVAFVVEGNARALGFYEALGWRRDGAVRQSEGGPQDRIRRSLEPVPTAAA